MHHACGNLKVITHADPLPLTAHPHQQHVGRQRLRLKVDLQRADPRRDINNAVAGLRFQRLHQRMNAKT